MTEHLIKYRGSLRGLSALGSTLVFTTEHRENQPTAVYQYDLKKKSLIATALDCGVSAQVLIGDKLWFGGTDNVLRNLVLGKSPKSIGEAFESRIVAICAYSGGVAVLEGDAMHLVSDKGIQSSFDLGEQGSAITSDPSGKWIVAGTRRGHVFVFTDDGGFSQTAKERLHDGEVSALAFSPDELRFYSTGSDCRLLVSFARGAFDTEDRSGNNGHAKTTMSILVGPTTETADGSHSRLYTAGLDSVIKSWPRESSGSQRPASFADGVVKTTALALVEYEGKTHLAAAGRDSTIRIFSLDTEGKLELLVSTIRDAYAMETAALSSSKPKERGTALEAVAGFNDQKALKILSKHIGAESDHKLQVKGVNLIVKMKHPDSPKHLKTFVGHDASEVRLAAFNGLRSLEGDSVEILQLGLDAGHEDLGLVAVEAARALGTAAAVTQLRKTLDHANPLVRLTALQALEKHFGKDPEGTLVGLKSTHDDIRRMAILSLQKRGFVGTPIVDARLRRLWDDPDAQTRNWAFVVLAHRSANLVKALRAVNEDFHRNTYTLENLGKTAKDKKVPAAKPFDPKKLTEADFRPLLEAMGSRSVDVCLSGAMGLASLGDERSFGALLQLSRESNASARVNVCRAFQALGDARSVKRVRSMLNDSDALVQDAAVSALMSLQADQPLLAVRQCLGASESVRERALAHLFVTLKGKKTLSEEAQDLLRLALDDGAASLRKEAFKSVLNLAPNGGGVGTLRFILQSVHADVRNEVLQEAKPHRKDAAYRGVILTLVDDPDQNNRTEAFEFGLEKWASAEHESLFLAALDSRYVSQRIAAIHKLSARKDELRSLLVTALNDEKLEVRLEAIKAVIDADNSNLLADALGSEHLDVRVEAATALAAMGDERALPPLVEVVEQYQTLVSNKAEAEEIKTYRRSLGSALKGIRKLAHPDAIHAVLPLLDDESVASDAAETLLFIAHPSNLKLIREAAKHESKVVKAAAATALAYNGDPSQVSIVWGQGDNTKALFAALGIRSHQPDKVVEFVDVESIRQKALLVAFALELSEHGSVGIPERCLTLLSSNDGAVRLQAAQALEEYGSFDRFKAWIVSAMNGMKAKPDAWDADADTLVSLSRALGCDEPRIAVQAAHVLMLVLKPEADAFEAQWKLFEARYKGRFKSWTSAEKETEREPRLASAWQKLKAHVGLAVKPKSFEESLLAVAFGAYIGIARQNDQQTPQRTRVSAITGIGRIAAALTSLKEDGISVLLLGLGDPIQEVRERAFEVLTELDAPENVLSTEALSTGLPDMGFRGLQLMSKDPKSGNALLEKTLLESTNGLERQAAKLLADRMDWIGVYALGVDASSEEFRTKSVDGLAHEYGNKAAADALRAALGSQFKATRFHAATRLATKKDNACFDVLSEMLLESDTSFNLQAITGLQELKHVDAPRILLDRVENDPDSSAPVVALLDAAVSFQDISIASRLVGFIDRELHRDASFTAALELTGFGQYSWVDDDEVTPAWEKALRPRHPELFAELLELAYRIADPGMLGTLVGLAKWPAENADLDATLNALLGISQENVRHQTVQIVGWRLKNRGGPAEGLVDVLQGRDPLDQFYAAQGLALAGRGEGLTILRTAIDAMDDYSLRESAVLALGQLADPSTVDVLLGFANDPVNPLQEPAAEAIGHMSRTEQADAVFQTLKRLSADGEGTQESAMKGLRWFGSPGAWDLLRQRALGDNWWPAQQAVELLRFDDDSKDVVAKVLRENDDWDVANSAAASLLHMWGPESMEPHYLIMEACVEGIEQEEDALERIRKDGDAQRILELIPKIPEQCMEEREPSLVASLLSRSPLPVKEAAAMLSSDKSRTVAVAAQIVGRAGVDAKAYGKDVTSALKATHKAWSSAWTDFLANKRNAKTHLIDVGVRYRRLVWTAGQLEISQDEIITAATLPDHEQAIGIREDAVSSLGEPWFGKAGVSTLVGIATGKDARLRSMAAAELDRVAPDESAKLISKSLQDDVSFGRLIQSLEPDVASATLRDTIPKAAGVALPRLAALRDIEGLAAAMRNLDLEETTRRGAIDALARIPTDEVALKLAEFGADDDQDELLRKAAWRARRRVVRAVASRSEAP